MSVILGLHFGHDASVTVLAEGKIAAFVQRERLCRIKHAYSLDRATLEVALSRANISVASIDAVAVTSTQGSEPVLYNFPGVTLTYDASMIIGQPALLVETLGSNPVNIEHLCAPSMIERVLGTPRDPRTHPLFRYVFDEFSEISFEKLRRFPWLEAHIEMPGWEEPCGLSNFLQRINIEDCLSDERFRFGFHYPLQVNIDGISLPGVRLDHHLAHASSSYYRCGAQHAVILTNDGYGGRRIPFANGGVYLGWENKLVAVAPHFLTHGHLFDYVGRSLGLSAVGASGKLMGLAPYGLPAYFDSRFVGDAYDHARAGVNGSARGWLAFAYERCRALGHSEKNSVKSHLPFTEFQLNLAASTQRLFEEIWLSLVSASNSMLKSNNIEIDTLCLSGGAALNCPSNSRICREGGFPKVFIEPTCDDSGLSTGAALWLYHALLNNPLKRRAAFTADEAYNHSYTRNRIKAAILSNHQALIVEEASDFVLTAAVDLASGKIIGWFEDGSEMGPRALGHRSILADPRDRSMHHRVNEIKHREIWRPLAPAILAEYAPSYFDLSQLPDNSPFMLLTAQVIDSSLPAITHIDGSARVQTVTRENGNFHALLCAFYDFTGLPVLLNTSMNGPGEPIVETPDEAIRFLLNYGIDVLYLNGFRIRRRHGSSMTSPL